MGCGCNKKKVITASGNRVIVYQVLAPNGSVDAEFENRSDALSLASRTPGARVRQIAKVK